MTRPKSPILTDSELAVMRVVWARGEVFVRDVLEALQPQKSLAYTSVMSMMNTLKEKGFVSSERVGKAYLYRALISRTQAASQALRHVVGRFFDGSPSLLAHRLLSEESISEAEWAELWRKANEADAKEDES